MKCLKIKKYKYLICGSIQPRESKRCRSAFGSDYSFESSWVCLYQIYTSGFGEFLPFFLADLLKLCQVGWGASVNSNLQVFPQILNGIQVWALAGPLKDFHVLVLKPFQCCFGWIVGVIVLLEHKSLWQSQVFCTLKQVLLKDLPVFSSIHCSLDPYKSPSPWYWKASPEHDDAATTMLHGRDGVRWVMSCAQFPPDVALCIQAKDFDFCLMRQ